MDPYACLQPETETHRTEKALKRLAPDALLPFKAGKVEVRVQPEVSRTPVAQQITATLVNLLLRMKGIVTHVRVTGASDVGIEPGVPLSGTDLAEGLKALAVSLDGPESQFRVEFSTNHDEPAHVVASVGNADGDIQLGADAWRALIGGYSASARWGDRSPLGSLMAAAIGAAETFKHLLPLNTGWSDGRMIDDLAFSLYDFGVDGAAGVGTDVEALRVPDLAVAGAGAGGTALLYTLASFPNVSGNVTVVEPQRLKLSSLGRYLMTTYGQVHRPDHKLESVERFLEQYAPCLVADCVDAMWHEANRVARRIVATVDSPEGRWDVQRSRADETLEAGVALGTLYAVLRVVDGGWCLECKHPSDPEVTWRKRARRWGTSVADVKRRYVARSCVTREDVEQLARVQNRSVASLAELEGVPFDEVPALTECGEGPLSLRVPSQAPVLPFATTAAGVVLAAELVKSLTGLGSRLNNFFAHDLRFRPRADRHVFKPRRTGCPACGQG